MFLKRRLAAFAPVIVAVAVGAPVASASAATIPAANPASNPRCPDGYVGPTNLATGCPYWMMVDENGRPAFPASASATWSGHAVTLP